MSWIYEKTIDNEDITYMRSKRVNWIVCEQTQVHSKINESSLEILSNLMTNMKSTRTQKQI